MASKKDILGTEQNLGSWQIKENQILHTGAASHHIPPYQIIL
jgi:hypothetical protein